MRESTAASPATDQVRASPRAATRSGSPPRLEAPEETGGRPEPLQTSLPGNGRAELSGVRAIVTDAETRLGLYVIRSLGRAGCRVTALSRKRTGSVIGFSSRFAAETLRLPPGRYKEVLPGAVEALAADHDLVIPITTFSISVLGRAAERFEGRIRSCLPPLESLRSAQDKRATTRAGNEAGIPVPETYEDLDPDWIGHWAHDSGREYPLVVKFADEQRSGSWDPADRYRIVRSPDELVEAYRRMHELGSTIVQEYVEGAGYGFFALFCPSGNPVATFCHRRLREYPVTGGPSTLCESVHDEKLVELGTRLLRVLEWRGVAMVEFKRDRRTGEYKLLEINPRFWGSLPLAIHSGVDFPVYQAQLALGLEPAPPSTYPVGRKMRFFFPDLRAVMDELRLGDRSATLWRYLGELGDLTIKDGIFDLDDPRPLLTYLRQNLSL